MLTVKRDADFAIEALAGLASKENFSQVELRDSSSLPASLAMRRNPFCNLMLLHIKGQMECCERFRLVPLAKQPTVLLHSN